VIAVSRKANPEVNVEDAMIFIEYLLSDGQKIIREYGMEEYGRPLFYGMK
jgi:ABC-type tungstate transport system permease subunit